MISKHRFDREKILSLIYADFFGIILILLISLKKLKKNNASYNFFIILFNEHIYNKVLISIFNLLFYNKK